MKRFQTRIKDNYKIKDWRFDLPYKNRLDENLFNQNDYLPPELLKLSGELGIGINLSLYEKSTEDIENEK